MPIEYMNDKLNFIVGDIRNTKMINNAMMRVNYLFHAGAFKQVPSCEFYPLEAIKNNYAIDEFSGIEIIDVVSILHSNQEVNVKSWLK